MKKYSLLIIFIAVWTAGIVIYPRVAEISALDMNTVEGWSIDYKDNKGVMSLIEEAVADDKVTKNEYKNILYLIVDTTEAEYEKDRANNLKKIKANLE